MPDPTPVPDLTLRQQRERTVAALCEHFAHDRLSMDELERRIDIAERTTNTGALAALLQDLPVPAPEGAPAAAPAPLPTTRAPGPAVERAANHTIFSFMGGVERRGHWRPAARNFVIAVMGGTELDFRELTLPAGETEVVVLALMGGVEIIVPPDMAVDASGIAIMGGFAHVAEPQTLGPDAPRLRVHGVAFMGGVEVHVRHRGESARDARKRRREEQRRLR